MLKEHNLPIYFSREAVNTACYVPNYVLIRPILGKTPYELWHDNVLKLPYFHVFRCKCFVLNMKDNFHNFDTKANEGIFVGYSSKSKAYHIYNKRTKVVEETIHVTFDETNPFKPRKEESFDNVGNTLEKTSIGDKPSTSQASTSQNQNEGENET